MPNWGIFLYFGGTLLGFQNFGPGGSLWWKFRVGPSRGSEASRSVANKNLHSLLFLALRLCWCTSGAL